AYIINTSLSPLGEPGDKPFLYPMILAAALEIGGIDEFPLRIVSVIASLLTGILLFFTVGIIGGKRPSLFSGLIYLSLPLIANAGRHVAAEPVLVAFAMAGVYFFLLGCRKNRLVHALIAGILFGAGFLCKLWLVLIPAFGVITGITLFETFSDERSKWGFRILPILLSAAAGFLAVAPLHLILCALLTPETVGHWIDIYFGFSLASRTTGTGYASYWIQPWYFYFSTIARASALYLPLMCAGLFSFRKRWRNSPAAYIISAWLLPLIPMSFMPVKSGGYVLPLVPPLTILAAYGLDRLIDPGPRSDARGALLPAGMALIFVVLTQITLTVNYHPVVNNYPLLFIQLIWILIILSESLPYRVFRSYTPRVFVLVFLLTMTAGLYRDRQITKAMVHTTGYQYIAETSAPLLSGLDPRTPCFYSPEWPSISFYTFRTGSYWQSPYHELDRPAIIKTIESKKPFLYIFGDKDSQLYGDLGDDTLRNNLRLKTLPLDSGAADGSSFVEARVNHAMANRR
ncbi:MAG: hypothetical protein GF417_02575, partial [Candidatus Latescibacteria bacterium]|nr:hypothetical protein [bacterium]MBD3423314.1 hypothetical protein [Candidatus Latescibacterota bacterium]